jgi:V/A-type H+-transporting ATPase subunit C
MSVAAQRRRQQARGNDYGYTNARIRGMRSRLLSKDFLDELAGQPDLQHLIQELSETEYGPFLEETTIKGRDALAVDEALKNNMVHEFQKILNFLHEEAHHILTTILGRWDVFNIKTVLRGKHMHLSAEQIAEGLLPVGSLNQIDLEALAMQDDVRAVVDTAMTWGLPFGSALRRGYTKFAETGELSALELEVDRYYTSWAIDRLSRNRQNYQLARKIVAMQIDTLNLVMVLRLQKADVTDVEVEPFFLEGGLHIDLEDYRTLAVMSDIDEVLDELRGTSYGIVLDDAAVKFLEENSIAVFERALEDHLMRKALLMGSGDPLGIGVAIAYVWAKQNEITNLRIIVKGASVGMPEERVRGELILV